MTSLADHSIYYIPQFLNYVNANYGYTRGLEIAVSPKTLDSCTAADNILLGQAFTISSCQISGIPTVMEYNTCLTDTGISGNCRVCLIGVVTTILNCLETCGYDGSTITTPTATDCIACLATIASQMQDSSQFLSSCGVTASTSSSLIGVIDPMSRTTKGGPSRMRAKALFLFSLTILSLII